MRRRGLLGFLGGAALLAFASSASANHVAPVELDVLIGGSMAGSYTEDDLGCSQAGNNVSCAGSSLEVGGSTGISLDSWSLLLDPDPAVSGITAVTNLSGSTQQFTLIFTLPTTVAPSSLMGGSLQGGATDQDGDGVTLAAPTGSALYTASIDGATQQTLYADPNSFSAGSFLSANVPNLAWGTPIPSAPGPAVNTNIRIQLDFTLSGNDSASFTSNFVVVPIPEPATALMFALGLVGLAVGGHRLR